MSTLTHVTGHKRILLRSGKLPSSLLQQIAERLRQGAVAIFPTETVYGMGTSAFSPVGIQRLYRLKGRTWSKPLALLVSSLEAARPLVEHFPPEAFRLAEAFWPGPLTMVLRASTLGRLVTGGRSTLGIRVPRHAVALDLLQAVGFPLATTSVNRAGQKPAISGSRATRLFGSRVEWLLDGGLCKVKEASSVVDLSSYPFTVVREGALTKTLLAHTIAKKR